MENSKYIVHARMRLGRKVPRESIIKGIIMNLQEVLGGYFNVRKLQKSKGIWFEVKTNSVGKGSNDEIKMFSRLNDVETAIFAAALESVEKFGSTQVKVNVERIEDFMVKKRKEIVERAGKILTSGIMDPAPPSSRIKKEVARSIDLSRKKIGG